MKRTYKLTILVVAFLFSLTMFVGSLKAAEVVEQHRISWTAPTKRVDGSALAAGDIKAYEIFYGDFPVALKGKKLISLTPDKLQHLVDLDVPGQYCYKARTIDKGNRAGPFSPPACLDLKSLPIAPTIQIEIVINVTQ